MTVKAWHWHSDTLRTGEPLPPIGEALVHEGPVQICSSGLHASRLVLDGLRWAPGDYVSRVECDDIVEEQNDKLVCRRRTRLWTVDAEEILRKFARRCALDVMDLWDAPDVVVEYLQTGDESLRVAARDAAWYAAWSAAQAARDAARAAAWSATWSAARDAAWYAAHAAHAARDDMKENQNRRLTAMISAAERIEK